jgi:hypothetical protein
VIQPSQGIVFPDATVQVTAYPGPVGATAWGTITGTLSAQTDLQSALNAKLSSATAATTYAPIAAGQPTSGTVGQVLTKNSGTNYDSSWATLIPGDRYLTSSTTSLTINNADKTLTIGTGLSYTPEQDVIIAYDATHHMHARVTTYNSGTGVMEVSVISHTGTGTYAFWTVNVGGTVPLQSVEWGEVLGTLGDQADLASALSAKLEITDAASTYYPLTNPAGYITSSALSGYATESWVDAQGYLQAGALTGYATESWVTGQGYLTDAPSDGSQYARKNGAWDVVSAGSSYITSVTSPLTVTSGDLSIDLSAYETVSNAAATYLSIVDAATGYYPLSNPSGFITSSALTGYATESFVTSQGYATESFVTSQGYITSSTLIGYAQLAGATFTGEIVTAASTTATAGLTLPHGTAPTTPVNGEIWTTTGGLFARINGGTQQFPALSTNNTFSNASSTYGSSTATGTINLASGATVSASTKTVNVATGGVSGSTTLTTIGPVLGASTTSIGGTTAASTLNLATGATLTATTKAVNIGTSGVAGSTTNIAIGSTTGTSTTTLQGNVTASGLTLDLGNSTATSASYTLGGGASISGATKTVNIGTGGVAGSTTTVNIGSTLNTTNVNFSVTNGTISLGGNATAATQAVDTNSTALATTAFVVGQAGSATPLVNGTAAVGTSLRYARQDHVHGTDTTRAPLASPTFTGTPLSTTAAVDTNTTQIATTAYVVGNGYLKSATASSTYAPLASPALTGTPTAPTATAGTNTTQIATTAFVLANASSGATWGSITGTLSSQTDLQNALNAKAPLASPSLTGTPLSTTAAADTNTTQIATTAFVIGQASATSPVMDGTATVGTSAKYARADHVHPTDTTRAPLASPTFTGTVTIPAGASISGFAPLASPSFTGTPSLPTGTTAVTQTAGNNTTAVATTAFVTAAIPTNNVKAWVNFNGTGTVAIRASMNVSSITDNGAADYTVNFTTAISDANYSAVCTSNWVIGNNGQWAGGLQLHPTVAPTTTAVRLQQTAIADFTYCNVAILR